MLHAAIHLRWSCPLILPFNPFDAPNNLRPDPPAILVTHTGSAQVVTCLIAFCLLCHVTHYVQMPKHWGSQIREAFSRRLARPMKAESRTAQLSKVQPRRDSRTLSSPEIGSLGWSATMRGGDLALKTATWVASAHMYLGLTQCIHFTNVSKRGKKSQDLV